MITLWLLFAAMTVAVVVAVLRPLAGAAGSATDASAAADIAVYRDQLAEIEGDLQRALIEPAQADIARREIARRLLAAGPVTAAPQTTRAPPLRPVALAVAALLPTLAIALYGALGSPRLPAAPSAGRAAVLDKAPVDELITKVEARLAARPDDGQGHDVIAPVYFRMQRYADAANAYARAAALLGETPARLAGFAEATVLAANGVVTEPARLAYEKLATLQPDRIEPKFWLALALEQDGKRAAAAAAYRALLAAAPADASWRPLVDERLAAVTGGAKQQDTRPSLVEPNPGPRADDIAAAARLSGPERTAMIRSMVDGLAKRLATKPDDPQGWLRLIQSYTILGERDRAVASLAEARNKLAGDPQALADLAALAKTLGLGS